MPRSKLSINYELWMRNATHTDWQKVEHEINNKNMHLDHRINELLRESNKLSIGKSKDCSIYIPNDDLIDDIEGYIYFNSLGDIVYHHESDSPITVQDFNAKRFESKKSLLSILFPNNEHHNYLSLNSALFFGYNPDNNASSNNPKNIYKYSLVLSYFDVK